MTVEVFRDIPGYEGLYQVSNIGRVKSLPRSGDNNPSGRRLHERILKPDVNQHSHTQYHRVTLCKNGKTRRFLVHRLVASIFIPNPDNKPDINHIDFNGGNNNVDNLEWVTKAENMQHSDIAGRQIKPKMMGMEKSRSIRQQTAEVRFKQLLGDNFIRTWIGGEVPGFNYTKGKRFVEYKCLQCGVIHIDKHVYLYNRSGKCRNCHTRRMKI